MTALEKLRASKLKRSNDILKLWLCGAVILWVWVVML